MFASGIVNVVRLLTGVRASWQGCSPQAVQRVYFCNHTSHCDFAVILAALPEGLRRRTRPVAGADYWERSRFRHWLIHDALNGVVIDREPIPGRMHPVAEMGAALARGDSLILFPEGTRNTTRSRLLPFKSGLFRLATAHPGVEYVPVWIQNLSRVMPKGQFVPIPLRCTLAFGVPVSPLHGEEKDAFLDRARAALLALSSTRV